MSEVKGAAFTNGPTCEGVSFSASGYPMDMAVINVTDRYPAGEREWSVNKISHAMAYIVQGYGHLLFKDEPSVELEPKKTVKIPPESRYAWKSTGEEPLEFVMAFNPPFGDGEAYKVEKE